MKKSDLVRWGLILSTLTLTACGDTQEENVDSSAADGEETVLEDSSEENVEETEESPSVVTIEDAAGNTVEVPADPQTIAVFDNGQLDNLSTLGLGERVVLIASPNLPDHLSEYEDIEVAGSFFEIDLEVTNAAQPDLIIVAGRSSSAYDDLKDIAPTIDLSNDSTAYFDSIDSNLDRLGMIFGLEDEAEAIMSELKTELEELRERAEASELTTLMAMYNEGSLSAYGPGSRFGVVHDAFGFTPVDEGIEEANHGMEISFEYVLEMDPDLLFVIDRTAAIGGDTSSQPIEENAVIQQTSAFQSDSIYYLSPAAWYLAEGGVGTFRIMMDEVGQALD
ncbi:siderophore ABC transporter substrate-binding protein [Alkalibacterium sp. s-m-22]